MISGKLDYESDAMISRLKNKSACDTLISVNYTVEYYAMMSGELLRMYDRPDAVISDKLHSDVR